MVNDAVLLSKLPPFKNEQRLIADNQSTADIVQGLLLAHDYYADQYKRIAPYFVGNTPKQTIENIFDFLKDHVRYVIEPGIKQTIKSPAAIISTGASGSDCKNYSLFTAGILRAINRLGLQKIPYSFRFAGYRFGSNEIEHVFVVAWPGTKKETWIDPVLRNLDNREKWPNITKDYKFNDMALYGISGINRQVGASDLVRIFNKDIRTALSQQAAEFALAFLYMWINPGADRWRKFAPISASNPDLFSQFKIPFIVKEKQNRAADYFVKLKEAANMKDEELWTAIENGIAKAYGMKPSQLISVFLSGGSAGRIGFDPVTAAGAAKVVLNSLKSIFAGSPVTIDDNEILRFIPEPNDWRGWKNPTNGKPFGMFGDSVQSFLSTRTTNLPAPAAVTRSSASGGGARSSVMDRLNFQQSGGTTQASSNMWITLGLLGAAAAVFFSMNKKRR